MTTEEIVNLRKTLLENKSNDELEECSYRNILETLYCITTIKDPDSSVLDGIKDLSKALHCLKEHKEHCNWEESYPNIYKQFHKLIYHFNEFMTCKHNKENGQTYLIGLLEAHKKLGELVTSMKCISELEKSTIINFNKEKNNG